VAALADVLGIDRFVVAGYSMGGPIAQLTWRRHRDRVAGMVLCATFARPTSDPRQRAVMRSFGRMGRGTRLLSRRRQLDLLTRAADAATSARERPPWILAEVRSGSVPMIMEAAASMARFDSTEWLGEVDVPTGVVITERDDIVSPGRQHQLASLIPDAEIRRIAKGHDACVTDPAVFNPPFLELLDHVGADS